MLTHLVLCFLWLCQPTPKFYPCPFIEKNCLLWFVVTHFSTLLLVICADTHLSFVLVIYANTCWSLSIVICGNTHLFYVFVTPPFLFLLWFLPAQAKFLSLFSIKKLFLVMLIVNVFALSGEARRLTWSTQLCIALDKSFWVRVRRAHFCTDPEISFSYILGLDSVHIL